MNIVVLGAGNWGTVLAKVLAENNNNITLWTIEPDVAQDIRENKVNSKYLPNIILPNNISVEENLETALKDTEMIILAVPSHIVPIVSKQVTSHYTNQIIVDIAKGFDQNTNKRMSEIIEDIIPNATIVALSGPSIANEVAQKIPTCVSIASNNTEALQKVHQAFQTDYFKLYKTNDIVSLELGGSLKNIIAIAAGMCDGLNYGINTKSAIITLGLKELATLAQALGGNKETMYGLSGLGDLLVTSISQHGRNRKLGDLLGQGKTLEEIQQSQIQVMEGVQATKICKSLTEQYNLNLPLITFIYDILFNNADPKNIVNFL